MGRLALILSAGGLVGALAASAGSIWVGLRTNDDLGGSVLSIIMSTYPDELIPRLLIGALFLWGAYLLVRSGSRRHLESLAAACAFVGVTTGICMIIYGEITFARLPQPGSSARADIMPVHYLSAFAQMIAGLLASTLLLTIDVVRGASPRERGR